MAYGHFWRVNNPLLDEDAFFTFAAICAAMSFHAKAPRILGECGSDAVFEREYISFTGVEPENYDTFTIRFGDTGFRMVRTNQLPYDDLVTACLIAFKHSFPQQVIVSSDGTEQDWKAGKYLYEHTVKAVVSEKGPWSGLNVEEEGGAA